MLKVTETNSKTEKKPLTFPRLMRGLHTGSIYLVSMLNEEKYRAVPLVVKNTRAEEHTFPEHRMDSDYEDYEGTLEIYNDVSS